MPTDHPVLSVRPSTASVAPVDSAAGDSAAVPAHATPEATSVTVRDRRVALVPTALLMLAILLVAANLRPVVTSLGSVLDLVRGSLHTSSAWASVLTAVPGLCFGLAGFLAPPLAKRLGLARSVGVAMALLTAGALVRVVDGPAVVLGGTLIACAGIAVCNVLIPVVVKESYPHRIGLVTGLYTAALQLAAALGSLLTPPVAAAAGGWRPALGQWGLLAAIGTLGWIAVARHGSAPNEHTPLRTATDAPRADIAPESATSATRSNTSPESASGASRCNTSFESAGGALNEHTLPGSATGALYGDTSLGSAAGAPDEHTPPASAASAAGGHTSPPSAVSASHGHISSASAGSAADGHISSASAGGAADGHTPPASAGGALRGNTPASGAVGASGGHTSPPSAGGAHVVHTAAGGASVVHRSLLRSRLAWTVTAFFGLQSMFAYEMMGWAPQVLMSAGVSRGEAGAMAAVISVLGVPVSLLLAPVAARQHSQSLWLVGLTLLGAVGIVGLLVAPGAAPWVWSLCIGVGMGVFAIAVALIPLRTKTSTDTRSLSTMTQGVGYLLAAVGPLAFGLLHGATGGWTASLTLMLAGVAVQAVAGFFAGRPQYV